MKQQWQQLVSYSYGQSVVRFVSEFPVTRYKALCARILRSHFRVAITVPFFRDY